MNDRSTIEKRIVILILLWGLALRLLPALDHQQFNPLIDDSFYALSIARNIANGDGITYAGDPTNGFQPLFVFVCVPFYYLLGNHDALTIHAIVVMLALVGAATGCLLYMLLRRMGAGSGALFVTAIWSGSPYFIGHGVNGLETGLTAFFLTASALVYYAQVRDTEKPKWRGCVALGALLGLGVLSRIDMGLWAVAIAADWILRPSSLPRLRRIPPLAVVAATAGLISSPWFLYNVIVFGSLLPTSGGGVRFISLSMGYHVWGRSSTFFPVDHIPFDYYYLSFASSLRKILDAVAIPLVVFTPRGFIIMTLLALFVAGMRFWRRLLTCPAFLLFIIFQIVAYSTWIFGQWFYGRYYFTTVLSVTIVLGLLIEALAERFAYVRQARLPISVLVAFMMGCLGWHSSPQVFLRGEIRNGAEHMNGVNLVRDRVPTGARVGVFQSGAFEYYGRDWLAVNLDGVVNHAAHEAMREKRMAAYLREKEINWMMDLDWVIEALYARRAGQPEPMSEWALVARAGDMHLYRRQVETGNGEP